MTNPVELPLEYQLKIQHLANEIRAIDDMDRLKNMAVCIVQNALTYQYLASKVLKEDIIGE